MGQVIHAEELSRLREEYSLFKENCQREKEELMVHHKHKHTYIHTYMHTYIHVYLHTYIRYMQCIHTSIHLIKYTYIQLYTHTFTLRLSASGLPANWTSYNWSYQRKAGSDSSSSEQCESFNTQLQTQMQTQLTLATVLSTSAATNQSHRAGH